MSAVRRSALAVGVALALATIAAPGVTHAGNRAEADRHFKAAQAAERAGDFRAAISEYQAAYDAAPHPTVLFNIGNAYERVGEARHAAEFFGRYLAEDATAEDRAEVEARIGRLAARPSTVTITSDPPGAVVFVDGERRGEAPIEVTLAGGDHQIYAAAGGRTTPARPVRVAYGEPLRVDIDLRARQGWLTVDADVSGAEVLLDDVVIGLTPFSGAVPAGDHVLLVSKAGYASVQRGAQVPADGSARVAVSLTALGGEGGGPEIPAGGGGRKLLLQLDYGYDAAAKTFRYMVGAGARTAGGGADGLVLAGIVGNSGLALGAQLRLFPWQRRGRLYVAVSGLFGASVGDEGRFGAAQVDLGFLIGGHDENATGIDYFVSIGAGARFGDASGPALLVPVLVGGVLRLGR